ncbi:hypothetical protein [Actinoplanes awajinensis]|uniref:hypothetical protein n=1 Tax=Actinoplanes awajinensis TaxID=135946 RepID=UPI0018DBE47F
MPQPLHGLGVAALGLALDGLVVEGRSAEEFAGHVLRSGDHRGHGHGVAEELSVVIGGDDPLGRTAVIDDLRPPVLTEQVDTPGRQPEGDSDAAARAAPVTCQ